MLRTITIQTLILSSIFANQLLAQQFFFAANCPSPNFYQFQYVDGIKTASHFQHFYSLTVKKEQTPITFTHDAVLNCYDNFVKLEGFSNLPNCCCWWENENGMQFWGKILLTSHPGSYTFNARNPQNGRISKSTAQVKDVRVFPKLVATGETITCQNEEVTLHLSAIPHRLQFRWTGPDDFSSTIASPSVRVPGTYFLTITEPNSGCSSLAEVEVSSDLTPPTIKLSSPDTLSVIRPSILLDANGSSIGNQFKYFWWKDTELLPLTEISQKIEVKEAGLYKLLIINVLNGCMASERVEVVEKDNNHCEKSEYEGDFPIFNMTPEKVRTSLFIQKFYLETKQSSNHVQHANLDTIIEN